MWGTYVEDPQHPTVQITLDTPAWYSWLEAATTRGFTYPVFDPVMGYIVGFMTVRKEQRQRGGWYWSVYRRDGGRLRRVYLGASKTVTLARLKEIAEAFRPVHDSDVLERYGRSDRSA